MNNEKYRNGYDRNGNQSFMMKWLNRNSLILAQGAKKLGVSTDTMSEYRDSEGHELPVVILYCMAAISDKVELPLSDTAPIIKVIRRTHVWLEELAERLEMPLEELTLQVAQKVGENRVFALACYQACTDQSSRRRGF